MFQPTTFHFLYRSYDEDSATARLAYRFDDGPELVESIRFAGAEGALDGPRRAAFDRALEALHLAAGISYYKAGVPREVRLDRGSADRWTADFFEAFYRRGLGEFAWRNGLSLEDRPAFPRETGEASSPERLELPRHTAVTIGGGKDSIVALEMMRRSGEPLTLVSVGSSPLIRAVAERSGLAHLDIERRLSPELARLNEEGAWNGHVPITGIIGFILVCGAVLYGYDTVVMANERSASSGNVEQPDGTQVNHQYSKSLEFERSFQQYIERRVLPGFRYFSILRPLSELEIARHFSFHRGYFDVFSSCNSNFTQTPPAGSGLWCRDCPKCRFVFLMLAPFIPRERLEEIFGGNLLDDERQVHGYDELLGVSGHKPFECVGDPDETMAAFCMISAHPDWRECAVVRRFIERVLPTVKNPDGLAQQVMKPDGEHRIPEEYRELADAPG